MKTVKEIQDAIAELPEPDRLRMISWIRTQEEDGFGNDSETLREAEKGAQQLDAGQGVTLDAARKLIATGGHRPPLH